MLQPFCTASAAQVANIPFYASAVIDSYALTPGQRLEVFAGANGEEKQSARATLLEVDQHLQMLVKYDDDGRVEGDVPLSRINVHGRATQECFNRTSTLECLSDHKGVKKEASTVRDLEER